jgi:hypothetical protein
MKATTLKEEVKENKVEELRKQLSGQCLILAGLKRIVPYAALGCEEIQKLEDDLRLSRMREDFFKDTGLTAKDVDIISMSESGGGNVRVDWYPKSAALKKIYGDRSDNHATYLNGRNYTRMQVMVSRQPLTEYAESTVPEELLKKTATLIESGLELKNFNVYWPTLQEVPAKKDPILAYVVNNVVWEVGRWD